MTDTVKLSDLGEVIETAYNGEVPAATQVEAEAGTETEIRRWSPLRVGQAISALAASDWGDIGGTLSNQADLQSALDGKSDTSHTHDTSDVTDIVTSTYGSGMLLIGDGSDSFDEQSVSGDGTLTSAGVLRVTQITDSGGSVIANASSGNLNLQNGAALEQAGTVVFDTDASLNNIYIGDGAGAAVTTGLRSVFVGSQAGLNVDEGLQNVCLGEGAGRDITNGDNNMCIGRRAAAGVTTGNDNTTVGNNTIRSSSNTNADGNIAIGESAGRGFVGDDNIFVGRDCADNVNGGDSCIYIGAQIDKDTASASNVMSIGNLIYSEGIDGTGTSISSGNIGIAVKSPSSRLQVDGAIRPATYTVGTVPSASTEGAGAEIHVSNGAAGNAVQAFSDGTNWLRCDTLAAISSS